MVRVVRAAVHRILLAAGVVSGIAIGIQALHSIVWVAAPAVVGASIAATFRNMRAAGNTAVTLITVFVCLSISEGVIAYGQHSSPPRAVER